MLPAKHAGCFLTTHWSMVMRAGDSQSPEAGLAMERLCADYWYPLYSFVRRTGHGHEDACDLTQGFFARFLEKDYLRSVDATRGKFRSFLLTAMKFHLSNEWDKSQAQRRGGGAVTFSLDEASAEERYGLEPVDHETPERLYERRWAEAVLSAVMDRLAAETEPARFGRLKDFLLGEKAGVSYTTAAEELGMSPAAVASAIQRLRARFRALFFEEVANTVEKAEDVEPELRYLLSALGG
jgi:DNA-directed RNA polymerase specialized sigma24 family protein